MRNTIKIVGAGDRMTGVSAKTNKSYDFQTIAILYPDRFITAGFKAGTCTVNGAEIDALGGLTVGAEYDAVFHTGANNAVYIDAILSKVESPMYTYGDADLM